MAKRNSFVDRLAREREADIAVNRRLARTYMLDMVTIALGRMGFRETRFRKFDEALTAACEDYGKLILDDSKCEKDIWYSKDNRTFRYEVLWNSGVAYAFPDQIVLGTV